jgi:hypothetical protein
MRVRSDGPSDAGPFLVGELRDLQRQPAARGQWRDEKREQGLRVIGIHMPRYEADTTSKQCAI